MFWCSGSSLDRCRIYSLVGKEGLVGTVMQAYRMPFLYASCGVVGESKIRVISKIGENNFRVKATTIEDPS